MREEEKEVQDRRISLLKVELEWCYDKNNIEIIVNYGKIFDEKTLDIKDLEKQVKDIKEKIVDVIKEELE